MEDRSEVGESYVCLSNLIVLILDIIYIYTY